jgi:hypothetical protein
MSTTKTSLFNSNESGGSATSEITALVKALEGPEYSYIKAMATPGELGAGTEPGDVKADLNAINDYVRVLIQGDGPARKGDSSQPIGDRYFLNTGAKCKGVTLTGNCSTESAGCPPIAEGDAALVPRYTVINNIPSGKSSIFPAHLSSTGTGFDSFEGILPGIISDVMQFEPAAMFSAFLLPPHPQCAEVAIDVNAGDGIASGHGGVDLNFESVKRHVILSDIHKQDPCIFTAKVNPVSKEKCQEGFSNLSKQPMRTIVPDNPSVKLYMFLVSLLGSYLVFKLLFKTKN